MAASHPFSDLRVRMSPQAQAAAAAESERLGQEMDLAQVRRALKLSQDEIAQTLQVAQASIAKIEKRTDT